MPDMSSFPAVDVKTLQQPDGSFAGDKWGEIDTRWDGN
jgi:prenyltransferase beta subunit